MDFKWNYKRAFLRCGLLSAAGVALQIAAGDVPAAFLRYPWTAVLAVNYLYLLVLAYVFSGRYKWLRTLWDDKACISSLASVLVVVIVSGFGRITASWPFVLILMYFTTVLGIRTIAEISGVGHLFRKTVSGPDRLRHLARTAMHAGIFVLLWAGIFGSGDKVRYKTVVPPEVPVVMASDASGNRIAFPFSITLHSFSVPPEADRYLSEITLTEKGGHRRDYDIEVNRPARHGAWRIYQSGYDSSGHWGTVSVLECVKDPWWPVICAALWAVLASALLIVCARLKPEWILLTAVLLAVACTGVYFAKIHGKTLVPALRSAWFVPHVAAYMAAYSVLGAAALVALYLWLRPSHEEPSERGMRLCDALVGTGSALLSAGMMMGALWAKQAWGDWWTWDPKETWAAATWAGYLLYIHLRGTRRIDYHTAFALILFSFLLIQMCWYGVNYLPSARGASLHLY